jgi:nucleotide-binding universal stress UspA family protein
MATAPIVAGVDGSPSSVAAAEQAAAVAQARGLPLSLVHGYLHPRGYGSAPLEPYQGYPPPPPPHAEVMLDDLAKHLRESHPGLVVAHKQVLGGGAASLIAESEQARLVVVGCRGHGGFAGLLLGSVSSQVVAHAHCPVLVIRPLEPREPAPDAPVLVGVDGSPGSTLAVAHAAAEAEHRDRSLLVISAGTPVTDDDVQRAELLVAEGVDAARQEHPGLTVEGRLWRSDDAAAGLIEASGQAAVVVVGSRGRGGFTGLLLGSVSQALAHHAHCPVLVIPPKAKAAISR